MFRRLRSDAGISRFPFLFALVAVMIAASITAFVLVDNQPGADAQAGAKAAAPTSVTNVAPPVMTPAAGTPTGALGTGSTTATAAPKATGSTAPKARSTAPKDRSTAPKAGSTAPKSSTAAQAGNAPASKSITYTVKPGDNLTVIAEWFKLHGYGKLYERNKAVIGDNPNLIYPGQEITVSSAGMTLGGS